MRDLRRGEWVERDSSAGRGDLEAAASFEIGFWYVSINPWTTGRTPSFVLLPATVTTTSVHRPASTQFRSLESSFSSFLSALSGLAQVFESGSAERHRLRERRESAGTESPLSVKREERRAIRTRRWAGRVGEMAEARERSPIEEGKSCARRAHSARRRRRSRD